MLNYTFSYDFETFQHGSMSKLKIIYELTLKVGVGDLNQRTYEIEKSEYDFYQPKFLKWNGKFTRIFDFIFDISRPLEFLLAKLVK